MAIVKRYEELTVADKIFLLHTMFPQDIKALLIFFQSHIPWLLDGAPEERIDLEGTTEGPNWIDVLTTLKEHIEAQFDDLATNPFQFVETFSKGKNKFYFLQSIIAFHSNNPRFIKAIDFLFGL